jgi:hypothetical protein
MIYKKGSRGSEVERLQERLKKLGYYLDRIDGIFGGKTDTAVRKYQETHNLEVDGLVGPITWESLFGEHERDITPLEELEADYLIDTPKYILYYHSYRDSIKWRLTREGVNVENIGIERTAGEPVTVRRIWENYGTAINRWAGEYNVPCELIVATICTETKGNPNAVREEPGYISDEETPHRVSPGLMQTLISTARATLHNPHINREWLLIPENSIQAGTSYLAQKRSRTDFDPPKIACAYNAGGIYHQKGVENRWKMRQYPIGTSHHADRFVKWFNDFFYFVSVAAIDLTVKYFR